MLKFTLVTRALANQQVLNDNSHSKRCSLCFLTHPSTLTPLGLFLGPGGHHCFHPAWNVPCSLRPRHHLFTESYPNTLASRITKPSPASYRTLHWSEHLLYSVLNCGWLFMSTSVDLSCFSVSPFKELYCSQKNKTCREEKTTIQEMKIHWILEWVNHYIFVKYFLLIVTGYIIL